ncbi:MAG TPA: hypothetical protein VM432_02120, partial [Bdellovibrionales bacterium]|nr:hypothetical protein [Bdellovibrionales bacterium]
MRFLSLLTAFQILSLSFSAFALREADMSGDDSGAVAVYTFDETSGDTAFDTSGVGAPLNLKLSTDGNLPTQDGTPIRVNAAIQSVDV